MTTATLNKFEVADKLGISVRTLQRWNAAGFLEAAGILETRGGGRGNESELHWPNHISSIQLSATKLFIIYMDGTIKATERRNITKEIF